MTERKARELARMDRGYRAKRIRGTDTWGVWDDVSDHWVEIEELVTEAA